MKTLVLALAVAVCSAAVAAADARIAQVKSADGEVSLLRGEVRMPLRTGDWLEVRDVIETGADGRFGATFIDNTLLSAGPRSRVEVTSFRFDSTTHDGEFSTRLRRGTLSVVSGQIAKRSSEAMTVTTPAAILGVRVTEFLVKVADD